MSGLESRKVVSGLRYIFLSAVYRTGFEQVSIRVGNVAPPAAGTGEDAVFEDNPLCGIFVGPGVSGSRDELTCAGEMIKMSSSSP